jgi:hypothetical protein
LQFVEVLSSRKFKFIASADEFVIDVNFNIKVVVIDVVAGS